MDTVRLWILEVADAVENGSKSITLVSANLERLHIETPDERQAILAAESLKTLPLPMQTLLKALLDLKKDQAVELARQFTNYDTTENAAMESNVSYACKALDVCAKDIRSIMDTGLKSFENEQLAKSLASEISACIQNSQGPKNWPKELEGLLRHLLGKQQIALKESSVVFAHKRLPISHAEVVHQAREAIDSSMKMRKRLEQLAHGNLDGPCVKSVSTTVQVDEKTAAVDHQTSNVENQLNLDECTEAVAKTRHLLRRVRQAMDGILRAQTLDIEDTRKSLIIGLQRTKMPTVTRNEQVPKAMLAIDKSLQEEIRLLLETLTVDRSALDLALRNIKNKCTYIIENNKAEASMTRAILMKRLKMQLQESFDKFIQSIQLY